MSTAHCTRCGHLFPMRDAEGNALGIAIPIYPDGSGVCGQCVEELKAKQK